MKTVVSLLCVVLLAGCGTAPMSLLEGQPYHRSNPNRFPVNIVAVNGHHSMQHSRQVYAGVNTIIVDAFSASSRRVASDAREQTLAFVVQPCTRYYLAKEFVRSPSLDWRLVVDHTEPVGGCNPQEEIEKSKRAGIPLAEFVQSRGDKK